jgi:hypothetical protein
MYGKKEGKKRNCHASLKKDCEPGFGLKPHNNNNNKEDQQLGTTFFCTNK